MAWVDRYANFDLTTGANDGTSEADAWQSLAAMNAGMTPGTRVYLKKTAAPLTLGLSDSNITIGAAGTLLNPNEIQSYETTPGDNGRFEIHFTFTERIVSFPNYCTAKNFKVTSTNPNGGSILGGAFNSVGINFDCECRGFGFANAFHNYLRLAGRATMTGVNQSNCHWANNFIKKISGGTETMIVLIDQFDIMFSFTNNLVVGANISGQSGFRIGRPGNGRGSLIHNNVFFNIQTNAIEYENESTNAKQFSVIFGNVFSEIGGYGVALQAGATRRGMTRTQSNFFHNCTIGPSDSPDELTDEHILLSSSPFVDPLADDFTINNAVGGGQIVRNYARNINLGDPSSMLIRPLGHFLGPVSIASGGTRAYFG